MIVTDINDLVSLIVQRSQLSLRFVVAIAGPPGTGKSTLSEALASRLPDQATILQADGFHYDNRLLNRLGRRNRKGAPDTFDCRGLELILQRVKSREQDVVVPVFDRHLDIARAGAVMIRSETKFVVVEGNYLALDAGPWAAMRRYFDLTVTIEVSRDELERRLMKRWTDLGQTLEEARAWVDGNDLPNVDLVRASGGPADVVWAGPLPA